MKAKFSSGDSPLSEGKWIDGLAAGTPLVDAARRVLAIRWSAVRDRLGPAMREPGRDPEHVHQLRVSTRRARAALDVFAACLPRKRYREARRLLRSLRRAAGAARDWDVCLAVLAGQLRKQPRPAMRAGLDFLVGHALAQRLAAQDDLIRHTPDPDEFDRFAAKLLSKLRKPSSGCHTLIDQARQVLFALLADLDQAAAADLSNYDNLHRVRICGKRLRYAMEIFAGCFPPAFRETYYAAVEEMQETLGRANDSHVALGRLAALREGTEGLAPRLYPRYRPVFDRLDAYYHDQLTMARQEFARWWRRWQKASSGKRGLVKLIRG